MIARCPVLRTGPRALLQCQQRVERDRRCRYRGGAFLVRCRLLQQEGGGGGRRAARAPLRLGGSQRADRRHRRDVAPPAAETAGQASRRQNLPRAKWINGVQIDVWAVRMRGMGLAGTGSECLWRTRTG
jgi:hypothetical protein